MICANNICLSYSYKNVLTGVSAKFENGKIYALLGENGAGKSTLAHIICGDIKPDSGQLEVDGKPVAFSCPKDALEHGIACVHQRPLLAESVSIKENLLIGAPKKSAGKIEQFISQWLPDVKSSQTVRNLSASQKFFVSLCGILLKSPKTLILDEPSSLLSESQRELLFKRLQEFAHRGMTIIIITHFLQEALFFTDKIILLKDGKMICEDDSSRFTEERIEKLLYVEEIKKSETDNDELNFLKISPNIDYIKCSDESFLEQTENNLIKSCNKFKTGIIPSDRTFRASNPELTIQQLLTAQKTFFKEKDLQSYAKRLTQSAKVNIKITEKCRNLSGGMLQRLILERELAKVPEELLLCEPFQGLDVDAVRKILEKIKYCSEKGVKVKILTSTPMEKIL